MESLNRAHFEKSLIDIEEGIQESWASVDQVVCQVLPCSVVHLEANIAFPQAEDFTYEVVLEILH